MATVTGIPYPSSTQARAETIDLDALKRSGKVFKENSGASILDIGEGIGLVEFHKCQFPQ